MAGRTVLNVFMPPDAIPGNRIEGIASSGDKVSFIVPKGVVPGARLQMVPTRQVIKRTGAIHVSPMHPMANGLNVLANSNALHLRNDHRAIFKASRSGRAWGRNFIVHADQSDGTDSPHTPKESEISSMPVAFVASESYKPCSSRACCWPQHAYRLSLFDELENEIATMSRGCVCGMTTPCFLCNDNKMVVKLGDGTTLGSIEQRRGFVCCNRSLEMRDHEERLLYTLAGPMQLAPNCLCQEFRMELHDGKGDGVGGLSNAHRGRLSSAFCGCCAGCFICPCVSADKYELTYPPSATVEEKLLLLSSNILLDFMLFQSPYGCFGESCDIVDIFKGGLC